MRWPLFVMPLALVLGLSFPERQALAQSHGTVGLTQLGDVANVASVEQRNTERANVSLRQEGGARAGLAASGEPGILQVDSARLEIRVAQRGEAEVAIRQQDVYLGWAIVTQTGNGHTASVLQRQSLDVQADILQTGSGHASTQIQTGTRGGVAYSRQGGSNNLSAISQTDSRNVAARVMQESGTGGEVHLVQRQMQDSSAAIWQKGADNWLTLVQSDGVALDSNVYQFGSGLRATIAQSGSGLTGNVQQSGTLQNAMIRQK